MKKAFSKQYDVRDKASETPTPAAGPCTTATTGLGSATIDRTARLAASSTASGPPVA